MGLIDKKNLLLSFLGDEEILLETIILFLSIYPDFITKIKQAIKENDCKSLEISAHTLKSVMSAFYVKDLRSLAHTLEDKGRLGQTGVSEQIITHLEGGIDELVRELAEMKTNLESSASYE